LHFLELGGAAPQDDTVPWDPFEVDESVLFQVVIVNDTNIAFSPATPYGNLQRRHMCLPLKETDTQPPPLVVDNRVWPTVGPDVVVEPMTQMSRLLVERLLKEIQAYFKDTTGDEHVCMLLNPFVLTFGMDYLVGQRIVATELKEHCRLEVVKQVVQYFGPDKEEIYKSIALEHEKSRAAGAEAAGSSVLQQGGIRPASPARTGRPATTAIYKLMQMKLASQAAAAAVPMARLNMSLEEKQQTRYEEELKKIEDSVRDEINKYEEHFKGFISDVDEQGLPNDTKWMQMIREFPSALGLREMKNKEDDAIFQIWRDNYCPMDAVYSTKRFDIVGWWMDNAHGGRFRLLQGLAVVHLAQPYTNAYVERVFSRGTWVDGARSQRTLDTTFEMRVLDADNRRLVEMAKPVLDLTDKQNNVDTKVHDTTVQKIKEALARFAESVDNDWMEPTTTAEGEEDSEKDDGEPDATEVVVTLATMNSDGDDDDNEESEDSSDEDVFADVKKDNFDNDVDVLLRHIAAAKQKPGPTSKK
jgi:hAT family C-terminal dimerisation region